MTHEGQVTQIIIILNVFVSNSVAFKETHWINLRAAFGWRHVPLLNKHNICIDTTHQK